jgi:hypothetical protein
MYARLMFDNLNCPQAGGKMLRKIALALGEYVNDKEAGFKHSRMAGRGLFNADEYQRRFKRHRTKSGNRNTVKPVFGIFCRNHGYAARKA